MPEPYLIAHKVRGEPAFDVAVRQVCAECNGCGFRFTDWGKPDCVECEGKGYWWIIPTSGHRAHPWWNVSLSLLGTGCDHYIHDRCPEMPPSLPDHYPHGSAPKQALDISKLIKPKPFKMNRRV